MATVEEITDLVVLRMAGLFRLPHDPSKDPEGFARFAHEYYRQLGGFTPLQLARGMDAVMVDWDKAGCPRPHVIVQAVRDGMKGAEAAGDYRRWADETVHALRAQHKLSPHQEGAHERMKASKAAILRGEIPEHLKKEGEPIPAPQK